MIQNTNCVIFTFFYWLLVVTDCFTPIKIVVADAHISWGIFGLNDFISDVDIVINHNTLSMWASTTTIIQINRVNLFYPKCLINRLWLPHNLSSEHWRL